VADWASRLELPADAAPMMGHAPVTAEAVRMSVKYGLPPPPTFVTPDISLNAALFARVQAWAGRAFSIDLCASPIDRQVTRFVGRYNWQHPDQVATNVLAHAPAPGEFCFVAPPWRLIAPVFRHLRDCGAVGVALVPYTPTAVWWSAAFAHVGFRDDSHVVEVARAGTPGVYETRAVHPPTPTGTLRADLLAVKFDFKP
jgi:hypothetical protein